MRQRLRKSWRKATGYVGAHWRGEHSLARAFWINAIVLSVVASFLLGLVAAGLLIGWSRFDQRLLWLPGGPLSWIFAPFGFAISIWATLGVVRSAQRALAQGARWKPLLAVMIVAGFSIWNPIELLLHFRNDFVELQNFLKILDRNVVLKILPDDTELLIMGSIGFGFADKIERTLQDNPQVRTVKLASGGGLGFEAQRAAQTIRRRGLDTHAVHECYSACTTLFLAGRERILGNNAILGFHAPFPIERTGNLATAAKKYEAELRQAGVPTDFAHRVVKTPHDTIWHPTLDELFAAGVITHVETTPERYIEMLSGPSSQTGDTRRRN